MTGGINPALQLLQASSPQGLLNRASIMTQIEQENGVKVSLVAAAETAAQRARRPPRRSSSRPRHWLRRWRPR